MAVDFFYKIQIGPTLFITSDETTDGVVAIAEVDGLDAFEILDGSTPVVGQDIKALSGDVDTQLQEVVDAPIVITFPLLDSDIVDDISEVINSYISTPTPFTLAFTGSVRNFTGTGKPCWNPKPVSYAGKYQNGKLLNVVVRVYMTLS